MVRTSKAPVTDSKRSAKKEKSTPVKDAAPAPTPAPVEEAPAPTEEAPADEVNTLVSKMNDFNSKLQQLASIFASVKTDFKTLSKTVDREMKAAVKAASSRKRRKNENRAPSGFIKPCPISEELAKFLQKDIGTEMARTEVSKEINQYIVANNLRDKTNGRVIIPDKKLTSLLKVGKEDQLTYFNLQKYLKPHFIKSVPQTA
uniref:DM2 domain-containing protein n=1 Tax=viral metagenome TaxID=1070528 RepID=A0A6C0C1I2_9ZZZZ